MLLGMFITIIVLGFFFLVLGLVSGFTKKKLGLTISLLVLSASLFAVIGLESFNIEEQHCENQVSSAMTIGQLRGIPAYAPHDVYMLNHVSEDYLL